MNTNINLKLDNSLVLTLQNAFTNKLTVLGELLQNSRRAGASGIHIDTLTDSSGTTVTGYRVTDDGKGIDDFQNLLNLGVSGWNNDVISQDAPYGVGFLSAISSCSHIEVHSKGKMISANTSDILAMQPLGVVVSAEPKDKTTIHLTGVKIKTAQFKVYLQSLVLGFPVEVFLNDVRLFRPHAVSNLANPIDIEGDLYSIGRLLEGKPCNRVTAYIQGLPVKIGNDVSPELDLNFGYYGDKNVVHLDSGNFTARMPDRDILIDLKDAQKVIEKTILSIWMDFFTTQKAELSPEKFICKFWKPIHFNELSRQAFSHFFNDIPFVPKNIFNVVDDYPIAPGFEGNEFLSEVQSHEVLTEQDLANGRYEVYSVMDINRHNCQADENNTAIAFMYAYYKGDSVLIIDAAALSSKHWIQKYVQYIDDDNVNEFFDYSFVGDTLDSYYGIGLTCSGDTFFVDSCIIKNISSGETVNCKDDAFVLPDGEGIVIPHGEHSSNVVEQLTAFEDEYDTRQEETADAEAGSFFTYLKSVRCSDPVELFSQLLKDLSIHAFQVLRSSNLTVKIDDEGNFKVS